MDSTCNQLVTCAPFLSLNSPKHDYQKGEKVIVVVSFVRAVRDRLPEKFLQVINLFDATYPL